MSQGFGATPLSYFPPERAVLRCVQGALPGWSVSLARLRLTVGRNDPPLLSVDVNLGPLETSQPAVTSRRHAEILWEDGDLVVRDLGSTNGTFVNDRLLPGSVRGAVSPPCRLQVGDRVRFANIEFEIALEDG